MVYVSKPTRAIWRYLLSEFRALLCLSSAQWLNNGKHGQGTHSTKMGADSPAENILNVPNNLSAQKFEILMKSNKS